MIRIIISKAATTTRIAIMAIALAVTWVGCTVPAQSPTPPAQLPPTPSKEQPPPPPPPPPAPPSAGYDTPPPPPAAAAAPIPVTPFDQAVMSAANALFSQAKLPAASGAGSKHLLVIDPLIDGVSAMQSKATRSMESHIVELVRTKYSQFSLQPFRASNLREGPIVLVGTFTGINLQGQTTGKHEAYRICLVLADLKSGTIVSKGTARAELRGVDHSPTPYFQDSPAWMKEAPTEGYINTCQASKVGDPIQPAYLDGILSATLLSDAIAFYDRGRYREALEQYTAALPMPGGNQLRVYNGLYLTNLKLGRKTDSEAAFGKVVEYGLSKNRLAVKFLFKAGTTAFMPDRQISGDYSFWLKEIAKQASNSNVCLEVIGHTSRTGPEPLNERLSLLRAELIKRSLEADASNLKNRTIANGVGSRENLVGSGRDDISDALDRRVVFNVIAC